MAGTDGYTAFDGLNRVARGTLLEVALAVRAWVEQGRDLPLIFADGTGRVIDLSQYGTEADVRERVRVMEVGAAEEGAGVPRGRGRPRLGVVAREVTLLPRHWAWLASQRGGASATLRRLVDQARRAGEPAEAVRRSQDAAYRFLSAVAGDLAGYEEALRALYRGDAGRFESVTAAWPADVRGYARTLAAVGTERAAERGPRGGAGSGRARHTVNEAALLLREAGHVTVLTGAGVSAESGIPTFRAALTGLWSKYRPEDLATPEAFARDPRTVWEWYAERRAGVAAATPNAAHHAIAELARRVPRMTLATQNVDGLHARAGSPRALELHGNIMRTKRSRDGRIVETWDDGPPPPPPCPHCGAPLRPDVVWFGEPLPHDVLAEAAAASAECDLLLVVGTSGLVYPAAALPQAALAAGVPVVIIDPEPVPLSRAAGARHLRGGAATMLPDLLARAWPQVR